MDPRWKRELEQEAVAMLARVPSPAALRPRREDYPRVLVDEVVAEGRAGWERVWSTPPDAAELSLCVAAELVVEAAPAEELGRSAVFPRGYRLIASRLRPGPIWLCAEIVTTGVALDGLVRLDDRWAWFPKPWRVLPAGSPNTHWVE